MKNGWFDIIISNINGLNVAERHQLWMFAINDALLALYPMTGHRLVPCRRDAPIKTFRFAQVVQPTP